MEYLYGALLILFTLLGLALIPFGRPGTFVILAAAFIYGLVTGFAQMTWTTLFILLAAALLAEAAEAFAGIAGARRYGSGALGIAASIVGGIAGAILGAPVGFGLGFFGRGTQGGMGNLCRPPRRDGRQGSRRCGDGRGVHPADLRLSPGEG